MKKERQKMGEERSSDNKNFEIGKNRKKLEKEVLDKYDAVTKHLNELVDQLRKLKKLIEMKGGIKKDVKI